LELRLKPLEEIILGSGEQTCKSIAIHKNGKIVCAGDTQGPFGESNGGSYDAFILKVNESGKFE
jgi:hypothetical protein